MPTASEIAYGKALVDSTRQRWAEMGVRAAEAFNVAVSAAPEDYPARSHEAYTAITESDAAYADHLFTVVSQFDMEAG